MSPDYSLKESLNRKVSRAKRDLLNITILGAYVYIQVGLGRQELEFTFLYYYV